MAASNEWTEFHLTPEGWIAGTSKEDYKGITEIEPPKDRVITCKYREYMMCSGDEPTITTDTIWTAQQEIETQNLLNQYGECPKFLCFPKQLIPVSEIESLYRP